MTFARPELLWLAAALPALVAAGICGYAARRRRVARALGEPHLVRRLGGEGFDRFPLGRLVLLGVAAAAIGIAAAGPGWGWVTVEGPDRGRNIVFALDVSKSMWARDLEPDRLERQRVLARRVLRELQGDRLGLVVFAGRAHVLSPLTTDFSALDLFIDALDPEMVSRGGSSLSLAVRQAADLVRGAAPGTGDRAVVLVSDGEALEDRDAVLDAVGRAAAAGVVVHTVGVGTSIGAPVPEKNNRGETIGYVRWRGEVVVSRLDEPLLREIADRTGGVYVRLDDAGATARLLAALRGMERVAMDPERRLARPDRFAWFGLLALLLLAIDAVIGRRAVARLRPPAGPPLLGAVPRRRLHGHPASRTAIVALALSVALTGSFTGDVERGNRLYRDGRYAEAAEAYRAALAAGRDSPDLHYNLGTALLRLGDYEAGERHLRAALAATDPGVRERAHYNLGNRFLDDASRAEDAAVRERLLEAAVEAYKHALRVNPADVDAKWNLELALNERDELPPMPETGPDGGADDDDTDSGEDEPAPGDASPAPDGDVPDRGPLSREQAERILGAADQEERDLTRDRFREQGREPPVERDW